MTALPLTTALGAAEAEAAAGRPDRQFDRLVATLDLAPRPHAGCQALLAFLRRQRPRQRHAEVDRIWTLALQETWERPTALAPRLLPYLALSPGLAALLTDPSQLGEAHLAALERDDLLHALLAATPPPAPDWEALLARLIGRLLADGGDAVRGQPRLLTALALWAWNSERLALPDPEPEVAAAAHAPLRAAARDGAALPEALLAWAFLAAPPVAAEWAELLPRLPDGPLVRRLIAEPWQEATLAAALPPPARLDPELMAQYEQSPYPRWSDEPRGPCPPPARIAACLPPNPRVLLAGCGTGQQVLRAVDRYPGARISALDFSRTSLAHAQRACAAAGVENVEWRCADLLSLADSGERHEVVECIGVLHHLPDPAQGLRALAAVTAPGGLLCAAVYSARARAGLAALRARLPEVIDLHALRAALLRGDYGPPEPALIGSPDFYSRSGCRDLLLNVRERHYRLPEFVAEARAAGFDWLQLEAPAAVATQAEAQFRRPAETLTPAQWDCYEAGAPASFGGMFEVWFRRR